MLHCQAISSRCKHRTLNNNKTCVNINLVYSVPTESGWIRVTSPISGDSGDAGNKQNGVDIIEIRIVLSKSVDLFRVIPLLRDLILRDIGRGYADKNSEKFKSDTT